METKKFDIKTWAIIILGIALCVSFWFGQKSRIDNHADEIKLLREQNNSLVKTNDSLNIANVKIDGVINAINKKLDGNTEALVATKKELQDLKKKQNEVPRYVNRLSANGIASEFTNYLTKSSSTR